MGRQLETIKRNSRTRKRKEVVLFNFEGRNKTETIYFNHFKNRANPFNIKFAYGHSTDPLGMIQALINYMKENEISAKYGDKIYCLFDADINQEKQKEINQAIELAKKNEIEVILSIPSFELWYKLHDSYTSKTYNSNEALKNDLKKYILNYEKNLDVFEIIKPNMQNAIKNSKRLEKFQLENGKNLNSIDCNPYTAVYKPVEYLINKQK